MQGLPQGDDQASVAVSRGLPYLSGPALLISAGVHVLVLVVLMCCGGSTSASEEEPSNASESAEVAEKTESAAPADAPQPEHGKKEENPQSSVGRNFARGAGKRDTGSLDDLKGFPLDEQVRQPKIETRRVKPATKKAPSDREREVVDSRPAPKEDDVGEIDYYIVKKGDNLTKLAAAHGMTNYELAELNGKDVKRFANLKIGQKIKVRRK